MASTEIRTQLCDSSNRADIHYSTVPPPQSHICIINILERMILHDSVNLISQQISFSTGKVNSTSSRPADKGPAHIAPFNFVNIFSPNIETLRFAVFMLRNKNMTHHFMLDEYILASHIDDTYYPLESRLRILNMASTETQRNPRQFKFLLVINTSRTSISSLFSHYLCFRRDIVGVCGISVNVFFSYNFACALILSLRT